MNILYIGSGFVGTCSAAVMADSGHRVLVYDVNKEKIAKLSSNDSATIESCLFEAGLAELLMQSRDRIRFTSDYSDVESFLDSTELIFMCLPTPEKAGAEGESDLTYYDQAAKTLSQALGKRNAGAQSQYVVIVNKSTVPVSMLDATKRVMAGAGVKNFGVVSNPEFLVEGKAIEGSIHPERVVVGAESEQDFAVLRQAYARFHASPTVKYIEVSPIDAEAGKLLANYLLFSRLATTYDVVGRLTEVFPTMSFENIRTILTTDKRIGTWGFYDSVYAGGSCFIKDAASLAHQLEAVGAHADLVRGTLAANRWQRDHFLHRASEEARFDWVGKTVAILGVAFKQDTNDVRNSPAIDIVKELIECGVKQIRVYDPAAVPMFQHLFSPTVDPRYDNIIYSMSEAEALTGSAACLILTDWPRFRQLAPTIVATCPAPYLIMDGRRMIVGDYTMLQEKGYDVLAVGSAMMKGVRL